MTKIISTAANLAINHNVLTSVPFNEREHQFGSTMRSSGASTRLTAPVDGWYEAEGHLVFGNSTDGLRSAAFQKNGTTVLPGFGEMNCPPVTGKTYVPVRSGLIWLSQGDYLELCGKQVRTSGQDLPTDVHRNESFFTLRWVLPADTASVIKGGVIFNANLKYNNLRGLTPIPATQNAQRFSDGMTRSSALPVRCWKSLPLSATTLSCTRGTSSVRRRGHVRHGRALPVLDLRPRRLRVHGGLQRCLREVRTTFGGFGPNVIMLNSIEGFIMAPGGSTEDPNTPRRTYRTWAYPISGKRGRWFDFDFRVRSSSDPAVGSHELWINDGSGWVQQSFKDR